MTEGYIRGCVVKAEAQGRHDASGERVALHDDHDDIALVDVKTDATASVLSPNVWIRRPRKALTPLRSPDGTSKMYADENIEHDSPTPQKIRKDNVAKTPITKRKLACQDGDANLEGGTCQEHLLAEQQGRANAIRHENLPSNNADAHKTDQNSMEFDVKRKRRKSTKLQNSDFLLDEKDYMGALCNPGKRKNIDVAGDIQKALEENDRAEADLRDISDMENDIAKTRELILVLEQMLTSKTKHLEEIHAQNLTIKRIFSSISVIKDDFVTDGLSEDQKREKMLRIGQRLLQHIRGGASDGSHQSVQAQAGAVPRQCQISLSKQESLPMAAPDMHPMESQIAAAALIAAKGDPARALVSLLEKGLEARRKSS